MKKELETFINQRVVVDTSSSLIYIGTLAKVTDNCAVLSDADVHEDTDSLTSKELYIFETRTTGVKSNRENVYINLNYVVSFSPLEDVKRF
jgi:small nuclear ribonucleoprotein (snRNP)-like protein